MAGTAVTPLRVSAHDEDTGPDLTRWAPEAAPPLEAAEPVPAS
jgi:hypothetical protein